MSGFGKKKLVIIGGGASGLAAASKARRANPDFDITVIEKSDHPGTASCSLPLVIQGTLSPNQAFIKPIEWFTKDLHIKIMTGCEAVSIARNLHDVEFLSMKDGGTGTLQYDKLILAPGMKPELPNIQNFSDKKNVFSVKSLSETLGLIHYIEESKYKCAVVIGSGFHGISLAYALVKRGLEVSIIETLREPFSEFVTEIKNALSAEIEAAGIKMITGCRILSAGGEDYIESLETDAGKIAADIILPAVGFRPTADIAGEAGINLTADGFIITDDFRITNDFDVFACGDCSTVKCLITGEIINHPTAVNAVQTGYFAGWNSAGFKKAFLGTLKIRLNSIGGYHYGSAGLSLPEARRFGFDIMESTVSVDQPYQTGVKTILTLIFNRKNSRLIGAQAGGGVEIATELDILSLALQNGMTVDRLAFFEPAYLPQTKNILHPIHYAARKALKDL